MWVRVTLLCGIFCALACPVTALAWDFPAFKFTIDEFGGNKTVEGPTPKLPPVPADLDPRQQGQFLVDSGARALTQANDNMKTLRDAQASLNQSRTSYEGQKAAAEAKIRKLEEDMNPDAAEWTKQNEIVKEMTKRLKGLDADQKEIDDAVAATSKHQQLANDTIAQGVARGGRVSQCPGCGGGGAGGGGGGGLSAGEALLMAGLIGGGAAAAAAAMGGGEKDKKPAPTPDPNEELRRSRAAAEKANQERMALEGQIVTLGQRVNEDMARDARGFSAIALTVTSSQATMSPPNSLGLTYGLSEREAMGGPATRCYNATGQLVPCSFIPTNSSSRGVIALGTRANEADRPIRCFDANNRSVACPTPRTAQASAH